MVRRSAAVTAASSSSVRLIVGTARSLQLALHPDRLERGWRDRDPDHGFVTLLFGSGPELSLCPGPPLAKAFVRGSSDANASDGALGRFGKPWPPVGTAGGAKRELHDALLSARSRIRMTDLGPWPVTAPIAR
jgi:hypothetical protein